MNPRAGRWLAIVGIGEDGLDGVSGAGRALVADAELLVGGARQLAMIPANGIERVAWPSPLEDGIQALLRARGRRVTVLASGDPMHYGIGATLAARVPVEETIVVPAPSSFSLACARLGWSVAETGTLSLHGRPLDLLNAWLESGARLLALSENGATPAAVAGHLRAHGYGRSRLWALERLGGPRERILAGTAADWRANDVADLNLVAIECVAEPGAIVRARVPGLPDDAFRHDGQLTKREVRAVTLAKLAPGPRGLLWDVGAGCGSVAIEWMRVPGARRAIAIEPDASRRRLIADNAASLGAPGLEIVAGSAPEALQGLAAPDAVFVGGGSAHAGVIEACWAALAPGGRLVANAVTLEGEAKLVEWHGRVGGELVRIAIERAEPIGQRMGWRPARAVVQWAAAKP
ncbi:MAG TPA: precorrin-6y C5,15-methyltransferase (decarboxylating) subunit CbiE [Alphaproteobacteria bacterium]|nr:precorrin-6y C5,15-methyltransferase (decarboxylating) subunit CbiE [Alphaproteobacteria bacterium]